MLKDPCPTCKSLYLGSACPCEKGSTPYPLRCDCGKSASQIYADDLGEWPICSDCLALLEDEFAPIPLPDFNIFPEPNEIEPGPESFPSIDLPYAEGFFAAAMQVLHRFCCLRHA